MYTTDDERTILNVNGLKAAFHMPAAVLPKFKRKDGDGTWHPKDGEDAKGDEIIQGLPPGAPRFVFPVDEYKGCPSNWMNGSAKASSYWLPVRAGCGMWIDLNYNYSHSHHVACVVSIQGVNPITGQQTKKLRLEQYRTKCPIHDIPFGQERFCEQCNYKWDAQNYVASNCTPKGLLWIDGFRYADGVVRQYVFTKETCKGVAAQIIGDERVFAIGIAFYLSKKPKKEVEIAPELTSPTDSSKEDYWLPIRPSISPSVRIDKDKDIATFKRISIPLERKKLSKSSNTKDTQGVTQPDAVPDIKLRDTNDFAPRDPYVPKQKKIDNLKLECLKENPQLFGFPADDAYNLQQLASGDANLNMYYSDQDYDSGYISVITDIAPGEKLSPADVAGELQEKSPEEIENEMEKLEITAGARIRQRIYVDPEDPDFWCEEPIGFVYINYTDITTAEKIMAGGRKEMSGSFLHSLPVG